MVVTLDISPWISWYSTNKYQKYVDPSRHITAAALEHTYTLRNDRSKCIEDNDKKKKVERTTAIVRFPFRNMIMCKGQGSLKKMETCWNSRNAAFQAKDQMIRKKSKKTYILMEYTEYTMAQRTSRTSPFCAQWQLLPPRTGPIRP